MKCFLILNQGNYNSISLDSLKSKFALSDSKVIRKMVNNLILEGVILAKWNNDYLVYFDSDNSDVRFVKTIGTLEKDIQNITENNILLLEAAMKGES